MKFLRRKHRDRDLDQEIQAHLEMANRDRIARGESPAQAAGSTRREFGNITLVREVTREMWGWGSVERLVQDLRYTARLLRKSPGFATVAILSIALGIGVNTAIFSLVDSLMLESLSVRDPQKLVIVGNGTRPTGLSEGPGRPDIFSYPFFLKFRKFQQPFTDVYASGRAEHLDVFLSNGRRAGTEEETIRGRFVTGNFFSLLGIHASVGREFTENEVEVPGSAPVIVISRGFALRTFGDAADALGQKLIVNGSKFTIIGVMGPDFDGDVVGNPTDIWFPITMQAQANPGHYSLNNPEVSFLLMMGRLKRGVSLPQATVSVQMLCHRLFAELNKDNPDLTKSKIDVTPGAKGFSRVRHDFAMPLLILMGVVGLVLLICCANVANLQLARAAARGREMSLRLAVGAGQTRLVRQLLTESLVISLIGAALGLFVAFWGSRSLLRVVYQTGPLPLDIHLDRAVLLFAALLAILSGLLFGLAPALQAKRLDLMAMLRENKAQPNAFAKSFGKALVVSQIVFSLILMVAAGLFVRTLQNLKNLDVGYLRKGLILADLDFHAAGYPDSGVDQLVRNLLAKVETLPGVQSASASENGLFSGTDSDGNIDVEGFVPRSPQDKQNRYDRVGPSYFETIGAHMLTGRGIESQDTESSAPVVVINERMAQFYFPHQNPIGRHIFDSDDPSGKDRRAVTIVGVVHDVKQSKLREPVPRRFYMAFLQHRSTDPIDTLRLEIRTRASSAGLVNSVRRAIKSVDPRLPILDLSTAARLIDYDLQEEQLVAKLSGFFGLLAAVLAAIGLYGVMSYLTVRRTTEIGVRMALGAGRPLVMRMVLGETLRLVALGLAIGICASLFFASFLTKVLFGLSQFDPASIISAALVITLAAILATWLPARRASRIDPMAALRYE